MARSELELEALNVDPPNGEWEEFFSDFPLRVRVGRKRQKAAKNRFFCGAVSGEASVRKMVVLLRKSQKCLFSHRHVGGNDRVPVDPAGFLRAVEFKSGQNKKQKMRRAEVNLVARVATMSPRSMVT